MHHGVSKGIMRQLILNPTTKFPMLAEPPIIEAVLSWNFSEDQDRSILKESKQAIASLLPEYSEIRESYHFTFDITKQIATHEESSRFEGFTLSVPILGAENPQRRCRFLNTGIHFHQLKPYSNWETFVRESNRFYDAYVGLFGKPSIRSLATRFISLVKGVNVANVHEFIYENKFNHPFSNLKCESFFLRQEYDFDENHGYKVRVVQAIGELFSESEVLNGLILDIEVETKNPIEKDDCFSEILNEFRAMKNEVFFSIVKPEFVQMNPPVLESQVRNSLNEGKSS